MGTRNERLFIALAEYLCAVQGCGHRILGIFRIQVGRKISDTHSNAIRPGFVGKAWPCSCNRSSVSLQTSGDYDGLKIKHHDVPDTQTIS